MTPDKPILCLKGILNNHTFKSVSDFLYYIEDVPICIPQNVWLYLNLEKREKNKYKIIDFAEHKIQKS